MYQKSHVKNDQAFCIVKVHTCTKSKSVKFKIDTGSQDNSLPKRVFDALKLKDDHIVQIIPSNANLTAYSGQSLTSLGCCILKCTYNEKSLFVKFHVIDTCSAAILGLKDCLAFKLIELVYACTTNGPIPTTNLRDTPKGKAKVEDPQTPPNQGPTSKAESPIANKNQTLGNLTKDRVLSEYGDIFEGIGKFPGECLIQIDSSIPPVIHPPTQSTPSPT